MPSWQTNPPLEFESTEKAVRDIFTLSLMTQMHLHTGTHVDPPLHSLQEGKTIDIYPLASFMEEGVVVDLRKKLGRDHRKGSGEIQQFDTSRGCGYVVYRLV